MFYHRQPSPANNWSSSVQYPNYQSERRWKTISLLIIALVALILSVAALIVVFSVEHAWFSDSFNQTANAYGLWRLCFYANQTCDSWFSSNGPNSRFIYDRLSLAKAGINAWQALEIVFIFLATSSLCATIATAILHRFQHAIHYYLAILAVFCAWPAVCIGISALFVFGFSVYDPSPAPHSLGWCFYLNIAAVALCLIAAILLTIYAILIRVPVKPPETNAIIDSFTDVNGYPIATSPTAYVVVPRNKKGKQRAEEYRQVLYPQQYQPNTEYLPNPNYQMLPPYNQQPQARQTGLLTSRSSASVPPPPPPPPPAQPRYYPSSTTGFRYPPQPHWRRSESNPTEAVNDYVQRGIYRPSRLNPPEPRDEQVPARVLHYYTGFDHFSTVDPSDIILARQQASPAIRYNVPPYYSQNDYIKSAM